MRFPQQVTSLFLPAPPPAPAPTPGPLRPGLQGQTAFLVFIALASSAHAGEQVLDGKLHHLRVDGPGEWTEFPETAEGPRLEVRFEARRNEAEWTLRLRQQDVKQAWTVLLNGKERGRLVADENDMVVYLPLPAGALRDGENTLVIEPAHREPDDIRAGEIAVLDRPRAEVLSEAQVRLRVLSGDSSGAPEPIPCRITVVGAGGALVSLGAESGGLQAVRAGVIYSGNGAASFGLPAGTYTIHAGRGFEYGVESVAVTLRPGETFEKELTLRREVPTEEYVSCDTHIHTLTHSGHGDATLDERMLTLAGEGIELAIATEHNRQDDYGPAAERLGLRRFFTPVVGNEVTTSVGHFNIFPVPTGSSVPEHASKEWPAIFASIRERTGAPVVILNHPLDVHAGFRPFGPEHHDARTGENLDGWKLLANGIEVVNSGAQQTDVLAPYRGWFKLLDQGVMLTPVGSSDSHDVARFIVGQGRTYIRSRDDSPGRIDIGSAVKAFLEGRVLVSCGLLAEIEVNDAHGPGDLAPPGDEVKVAVTVLGPRWAVAEKVELYANGIGVREAAIPATEGRRAGVKWRGTWSLPRFAHDAHIVAIATGPGIREQYWPIAKPYQPASPSVDRRVVCSTGTVWIDGDGDGVRTAALHQAQRILEQSGTDLARMAKALSSHDEAVATQVAGLLRKKGVSVEDPSIAGMAREAGPHVERGFRAFSAARSEKPR